MLPHSVQAINVNVEILCVAAIFSINNLLNISSATAIGLKTEFKLFISVACNAQDSG